MEESPSTLESLYQLYQNPIIQRVISILIGVILILILSRFVKKAINEKVNNPDGRYRARKAVSLASYIVLAIMLMFIFSDKLGNIGVALGVAGAGIAFALQEVIVSVAGWISILVNATIGVGQRVKIGDTKGDIIDIGVINTTIMEMGDWVDADLYNGRIVTLANSFVFKENIHNYSAEYPFLWDEIQVPIRFESDYNFARELFTQVLVDVCGEYAQASEDEWKKLANRYRVEEAMVRPMTSLKFDENWITFTLRYIVDFKKRRSTKDLIFTKLLQEIKLHEDKIMIASSSMEVTNFPGKTE